MQLHVDLPIYSEDRQAAPPAAVTAFADQIRQADGVIWISPKGSQDAPGFNHGDEWLQTAIPH